MGSGAQAEATAGPSPKMVGITARGAGRVPGALAECCDAVPGRADAEEGDVGMGYTVASEPDG